MHKRKRGTNIYKPIYNYNANLLNSWDKNLWFSMKGVKIIFI